MRVTVYGVVVVVGCVCVFLFFFMFFFFQAEDGIRDDLVTGVQTCALPICIKSGGAPAARIGQYKKRWRCRNKKWAV